METPDLWVSLLHNFGLPVVGLFALSWAAVKVVTFFGKEFLIPSRDLFFKNILTLIDQLKEIASGIDKTVTEEVQILSERTKRFEKIESNQEIIIDATTHLEKIEQDWRDRHRELMQKIADLTNMVALKHSGK
jgi:hypothetical protein